MGQLSNAVFEFGRTGGEKCGAGNLGDNETREGLSTMTWWGEGEGAGLLAQMSCRCVKVGGGEGWLQNQNETKKGGGKHNNNGEPKHGGNRESLPGGAPVPLQPQASITSFHSC